MTEQCPYQEIQLDIQGMTWMSWEPKVIKALEGLDGVKTATASHPEKKAVVQYDPSRVTVGQMCRSLLTSGYVADQNDTHKTTLAEPPDRSLQAVDHQADDLVCYCFKYTISDIEQDFILNSRSRVMEKIVSEKKAGGCNCSTKNPKGRWCLADVRQVVDGIKKKVELGVSI